MKTSAYFVLISKRILVVLLVVFAFSAHAQLGNSDKTTAIYISGDTLRLDSLSIVPGSVQIKDSQNKPISLQAFNIDYANSLLSLNKENDEGASLLFSTITVHYATFPYSFTQQRSHKSSTLIVPNRYNNDLPFVYYANSPSGNLLDMGGLDKSGSIARSISFGNTQDLVVNSNLNLQLSGNVGNDVNILLAATDSNIPIQPEGNTQQLQEFDKVFIQVSKNQNKVIAGDYQLMPPKSYFMNFYKKAQGIQLSTVQNIQHKNKQLGNRGVFESSLSAAISRGKFSRNIIQGEEGNQGPYRLTGAENEQFIIILSGTERVYIDGRLMTRGQENDYIIDYNTAEITFTAKRLITKDKRIIVEFQYSDQNYTRSLMHFGSDYEEGKVNLHLHVYSEQDNKNQPLNQELSEAQQKLLSDVGDTLSLAISPSFDTVPFSSSEVLYKRVDSIIGANTYSVLVYSTSSDSAIYRASFSDVGLGNGNYVQALTSANGKVFQWIAPDPITNSPQGNYEPVVQLISPKQKQLITTGVDVALSQRTNLSVEGAISNNDLNTFSNRDAADDVGFGFKMKLDNSKVLANDTLGDKWKVNSNVNYEYVQKNFSFIERYRSVEFERDWNRASPAINTDQHILAGGVSLIRNTQFNAGYTYQTFLEGSSYNGNKHMSAISYNNNNFIANYDGSFMQSESDNNTGFYRHKSIVTKNTKFVKLGYKDEFEQNKYSLDKRDSLLSNSYQFWEWKVFAQNRDTAINKYGLEYVQRTDYKVKNQGLTADLNKATLGESYIAFLEFNKNPKSQLRLRTTYRTLAILDSSIINQSPDNTLLSRVEYSTRLWKGFVVSNTFYEMGSGLEVRKEFSYIEVAAGQGVYTWNDYNANGVQELDEFEIAAFSSDASFLRVYTPTLDYVKVFNNQFSEQLFLRPAVLWSNKKGIRKLISRFSNQSVYRIDRKSNEEDYEKAFNPFITSSLDTDISLNSSFRNTLFFNQSSPKFGVDISYQNIRNVSLLVNGIDERGNIFQEMRVRWNLNRAFSWNVAVKQGVKSFDSEFFETRDYNISYLETEPRLTYQPNTAFRLSLSYKYSSKDNTVSFQLAEMHNVGASLKYNILNKGSLNVTANFIDVTYNDVQNTSLAFEMLEALQIGENITWTVRYQRNISKNMQLSLNYEGRQSSGANVVHIGGAQVRAYF